MRAHKTSDLQFSLVFLTTMSASALLFRNDCLIYLFIHSLNFRWAVQLRYICKNWHFNIWGEVYENGIFTF